MQSVKITYLKNTEYVYEGDEVIAVWHTDTDSIIIDESVSPYTEEQIRTALKEAA